VQFGRDLNLTALKRVVFKYRIGAKDSHSRDEWLPSSVDSHFGYQRNGFCCDRWPSSLSCDLSRQNNQRPCSIGQFQATCIN
jgi:hypothetical protein